MANVKIKRCSFGFNKKGGKTRFLIKGKNLKKDYLVKVTKDALVWEGKLTHKFDGDNDRWVAVVSPTTADNPLVRDVGTLTITVTSNTDPADTDDAEADADIYSSDEQG